MSTSYPQQAEQTFVELVNLLGMTATTTSESKERGIYIKVDTPEPGRLIGRKGHWSLPRPASGRQNGGPSKAGLPLRMLGWSVSLTERWSCWEDRPIWSSWSP